MINVQIDKTITERIPQFKVGVIQYYDIAISDSPQMIKGRLQFFQETLGFELDTKSLTDYKGILEWRKIIRSLELDPDITTPSHESLYAHIKENGMLPLSHSAIDLTTFFSMYYVLPIGIYDTSKITGNVTLRLGFEDDSYEDTNGHPIHLSNQILSADHAGPFGSPIIDSMRTMVTTQSTSALQIIYLLPTMLSAEAEQLLTAIGSMFTQVHGGEYKSTVALPIE